jgi:hypothetical protein
MLRAHRLFSIALLLLVCPLQAGEKEETFRYLRPTAKGFVPAARITLRTTTDGWSIESVTGGGEREMNVSARYDGKDNLLSASATLHLEDAKAAALVKVTKGVARVEAKGAVQEVPVMAGTLVTSAPDWSDIFLLCRRYDARAAGKQEFQGLWIHPEQKTLALKFTIEREGADEIEHAGKKSDLGRYRIQIRGPNPYMAWADEHGVLVKLVPLPAKEGNGLIREGWEKTWAALTVAK